VRQQPGEEEDVYFCFQTSGWREFVFAGGEFVVFVQYGQCLRGVSPDWQFADLPLKIYCEAKKKCGENFLRISFL